MELGMFTSGYQRWPLELAFADARRFGYDYIELWGGRPHAFPPDLKGGTLGDVLALIDKYAMPVGVYTPEHNAYPYNFMLGSEIQRQDAISYLELAMEMGAALGAEYTLISTGHGGYAASRRTLWTRLIKSLSQLAHHAEKLGHILLLETLTPMESNLCTTADELAEALDAVGSPCLMAMCDLVPPFVQHEPVTCYWDKLGHRLRHLHLVDSDGTTDAHLLPGAGTFPLEELLSELRARGYQGRATIELVSAYQNEPSLYASQALRRVRGLLNGL